LKKIITTLGKEKIQETIGVKFVDFYKNGKSAGPKNANRVVINCKYTILSLKELQKESTEKPEGTPKREYGKA
jgi:hypothetical protein